MWDYDPAEASQVLPEGSYDGEIVAAEEANSKAGNSMMIVTWGIARADRVHKITDYIVRPTGIWKYQLIAEALGEGLAFANKTFDIHQHVGKFALLTLDIQKQPGYPDKNIITKYGSPNFEPVASAGPAPEKDEEIPFAWLLPLLLAVGSGLAS